MKDRGYFPKLITIIIVYSLISLLFTSCQEYIKDKPFVVISKQLSANSSRAPKNYKYEYELQGQFLRNGTKPVTTFYSNREFTIGTNLSLLETGTISTKEEVPAIIEEPAKDEPRQTKRYRKGNWE